MKFFIILFVTYAATCNAAPPSDINNVIIVLRNVSGHAEDGVLPDDDWNWEYSKNETCNVDIAAHLVRRMAPVGINFNIPPFDPLAGALISPVVVDTLNCTIDVSLVVIRGLQQYDLKQVVKLPNEEASFPNSKLIDYEFYLPSLTAEGNVTIKCPNGDLNLKNVRVVAENITSNGTVFLVLADDTGHYVVGGMKMDDHFDKIEVDALDKKSLSGRSRDRNSVEDILGDLIADAIIVVVENAINYVLSVYPANQVDAYLDAGDTLYMCNLN